MSARQWMSEAKGQLLGRIAALYRAGRRTAPGYVPKRRAAVYNREQTRFWSSRPMRATRASPPDLHLEGFRMTYHPEAPRDLPPSLRFALLVAGARAWEALLRTYTEHAAEFVERMARRYGPEEALSTFLDEADAPEAFRATIWVRTLASVRVEDVEAKDERPSIGLVSGVLTARGRELRRHATAYDKETVLWTNLMQSKVQAALLRTHVENTCMLAGVVGTSASVEGVLDWYREQYAVDPTSADMIRLKAGSQLADQIVPSSDAGVRERRGIEPWMPGRSSAPSVSDVDLRFAPPVPDSLNVAEMSRSTKDSSATAAVDLRDDAHRSVSARRSAMS